MTPDDFLRDIIDPGLTWLAKLGGPAVSDNTRRLLLAIAMQESGHDLAARYQNHPSTSAGPAKGFWQFEQSGGVRGVMTHTATKALAQKASSAANVAHHEQAIHRALEGHDNLATTYGRLLLLSDPQALATTQQAGWDYYNRNWRPGKPHPDRWPGSWAAADAAVKARPVQT